MMYGVRMGFVCHSGANGKLGLSLLRLDHSTLLLDTAIKLYSEIFMAADGFQRVWTSKYRGVLCFTRLCCNSAYECDEIESFR